MSHLQLEYDAFGRLVLTSPSGERWVGVVPVRAFPFSAAEECISFCDEAGHEIYFLADTQQLPEATRAVLARDLAQREFIPIIQRIDSVSPGAEPTTWRVETDRGATQFILNNEDNIRRMGPNGALVTDAHGVRYRIPDASQLDPRSLKILRRYL
jgi:Domain of unknown function (DUF1854)